MRSEVRSAWHRAGRMPHRYSRGRGTEREGDLAGSRPVRPRQCTHAGGSVPSLRSNCAKSSRRRRIGSSLPDTPTISHPDGPIPIQLGALRSQGRIRNSPPPLQIARSMPPASWQWAWQIRFPENRTTRQRTGPRTAEWRSPSRSRWGPFQREKQGTDAWVFDPIFQ